MNLSFVKDNTAKKFLEDYVEMCDEGIRIGNEFQPPKIENISNVLVCGMGGSGVCGDLLVDVAKLDVPIIVVKDYHIPKFANEKSLVFCLSYSGNTEETLTQMTQAKSVGCNVIAVTSGGKLKEWSERTGVPVITIPSGRNPRDALPLLMFPILITLQKLGLGKYDESFSELKNVLKNIDTETLDDLARKIKNSRLAIYSTSDHVGALRRIKNEFNENAKMAVIYDFFPELNHNEMNGFQRTGISKNIDVIFMRDPHETEEMKARIEITKGILQHYVNSINELWAAGDQKLTRTISFAFMASYLTGKIASMVGIDRNKVPFVDRLKDALKMKLNTTEKLEEKITEHEKRQ